MRYRTATISSAVLIGVMFGLPTFVQAVFLPSLERGFPDPIPRYEQLLLIASEFCIRWRLLLAIPIAITLFIIAGISSDRQWRRQNAACSQHKDGRFEVVKRLVGLVVIALVNAVGTIVYVVIKAFLSGQGKLGSSIAIVVGIGLSVALLTLQNWGRWIFLVSYGLFLAEMAISIVLSIVLVHNPAEILLMLVFASYPTWTIWYLFQPHVRGAFLKTER